MTKLNIFLIIISALLTVSILLQQRGEGLSSTFGGDGQAYHTKRGLEKNIFIASIILSMLFIGGALARLFFN